MLAHAWWGQWRSLGVQSCMSRSPPKYSPRWIPRCFIRFSLSLLRDHVCNYTRIMMNIIVLHQQIQENDSLLMQSQSWQNKVTRQTPNQQLRATWSTTQLVSHINSSDHPDYRDPYFCVGFVLLPLGCKCACSQTAASHPTTIRIRNLAQRESTRPALRKFAENSMAMYKIIVQLQACLLYSSLLEAVFSMEGMAGGGTVDSHGARS